MEQEVAASARAAIEFVLDGDTELRSVLAAIEDAERRDAAMALAEGYARCRPSTAIAPERARRPSCMDWASKRRITSAK